MKFAFGVFPLPEADIPKKGHRTRRGADFEALIALEDPIVTKAGVAPLRDQIAAQYYLRNTMLLELERSIALETPTHPWIEHSSEHDQFVVNVPGGNVLTMETLLETVLSTVRGFSGERIRTSSQGSADNVAAFNQSPPLLAWDRRTHEPLASFPADFYPRISLALLDFKLRDDHPKPVSLPDGMEQRARFRKIPFLRTLGKYPSYALATALDQRAHGAAAALIPACPSINDPARGGRINIEHMRVRMLTEQMWRELAEAWYRWPFRIDDETLDMKYSNSFKSVRR